MIEADTSKAYWTICGRVEEARESAGKCSMNVSHLGQLIIYMLYKKNPKKPRTQGPAELVITFGG